MDSVPKEVALRSGLVDVASAKIECQAEKRTTEAVSDSSELRDALLVAKVLYRGIQCRARLSWTVIGPPFLHAHARVFVRVLLEIAGYRI